MFDILYLINYKSIINYRSILNIGLFVQKSFKIFVEDRNDPPSGISCSLNSILETSLPGTNIGICNAIDEDISQKHIYSITYIFASGTSEHA